MKWRNDVEDRCDVEMNGCNGYVNLDFSFVFIFLVLRMRFSWFKIVK